MTDVKGVCGEASKGVEGVRRDSELEEVRKEGDRRKMVEAVKDIEGKEVESRKEDEEDEEDEEPESSQEGDFEEFAKSIRGDVVTSSDDTAKYEEAKRIWNGDWKIKNEPKYIVHCRGVSDVQKCVNFARANKLPLTVRCGGHSLKGLSTCLNGMVIDLGKYMRSVRVQRRKMEVWFEGGCRVKDIDAETAAFNLCTVMGAVGSAGAGGLVTGGGLGYFARKEGLSVDNVLSVDMVDANGNYLYADKDTNPELFWGVRGGQSNFGIVTGFTMRLFECPPKILGGMILYELREAKTLIAKYLEFTNDPAMPRECTIHLYSLSLPGDCAKYVSLQVCYLGDPTEGRKIINPLLNCVPCVVDQIQSRTYYEYQTFSDEVYRVKGVPSYWRSRNIKRGISLPVDTIIECINASPTEGIFVIEHYGAKATEYPSDATAYPHRDIDRVVTFNGFGFQDEAARIRVMEWIAFCTERLSILFTGGSYINYDGGTALDSFGSNLPRLRKVKRMYDPDNIFHCNTNIKPEGAD